MNTRLCWTVFCILFLLPSAVFASGSPDREYRTISVDLDLEGIVERDMLADPSIGVFIFLVEGNGRMDALGSFSYASMVFLEPAATPHGLCGGDDLSSDGMGTSTIFIPGKGALMMNIASGEQCMNLGTGEFKAKQTEVVVAGTGPLAGSSGEITLEVTGRIGEGQDIHMTGEILVPAD